MTQWPNPPQRGCIMCRARGYDCDTAEARVAPRATNFGCDHPASLSLKGHCSFLSTSLPVLLTWLAVLGSASRTRTLIEWGHQKLGCCWVRQLGSRINCLQRCVVVRFNCVMRPDREPPSCSLWAQSMSHIVVGWLHDVGLRLVTLLRLPGC